MDGMDVRVHVRIMCRLDKHACDHALLTLDRAWVMGHYFLFQLAPETTGVFTILFPKSFISFTLTSRYA